jgi:signal peptidase II
MSAGPRRAFFIVASLLALGLIANLLRKTTPAQQRLRWALTSLSAGAVGNLIDRVQRGSVTDFLHLHAGDAFHWATFNLADVYIAVGLCLLVFDMLRAAHRPDGRRSLSDRDATTP